MFTKIVDPFNLSTSKVYSPTHLRRLWFPGPTDGFSPTYWSDWEWEGDRLKCIWNRNTKSLYVTYGSRVHVQKYILTGVSIHEKGVSFSYMYIVSTITGDTSTWKPKFVKKNETHQASRFNCTSWIGPRRLSLYPGISGHIKSVLSSCMARN